MGLQDKFLKLVGRGPDGRARPINVDEDGNLKVSGMTGGGSSSSSFEAEDVDSGQLGVVTSIKDDRGNNVLRVVDAAPFIVEISKFDTVSHFNAGIAENSTVIAEDNPDRKYLYIQNDSPKTAYLSMGVDAVRGGGIPVKAGDSFEMSAMKGNLYKGPIFAISSPSSTAENLFNPDNVAQGGIGPSTGFTTSTTRTNVFPVNVEEGKTYTVKIDSPDVKVRNIYAVTGENRSDASVSEIMADTLLQTAEFTVPFGYSTVAVSFAKTTTTETLTPQETIDAGVTITQNSTNLLVTEGE